MKSRHSPARLEVVDRAPVEGDWGTPQVDDLVGIACEMVRRDSSLSHSLDMTETPPLVVEAASADVPKLLELYDKMGTGIRSALNVEIDSADIEDLMQALPRSGVFVATDGITDYKLLENPNSLSDSMKNYGLLQGNWTQETGMAPVETADSGNVESGVAVARRNAMLVLKTARLFGALYAASQMALYPYMWEYIGRRTAESMGEDAADEPEVEE